MPRFNLAGAKLGYDEGDPAGYHVGYVRIGPLVGAAMLGASLYELGPGQSVCPYHYEYGNEEWLLVVEGRPLLRAPDGEHELEPWDVLCFPVGPEGAYKVSDPGTGTVRVLMFSTKLEPSVAVYPDSDKIGVWPGDERDALMVRRESNVDYWDREAGKPG